MSFGCEHHKNRRTPCRSAISTSFAHLSTTRSGHSASASATSSRSPRGQLDPEGSVALAAILQRGQERFRQIGTPRRHTFGLEAHESRLGPFGGQLDAQRLGQQRIVPALGGHAFGPQQQGKLQVVPVFFPEMLVHVVAAQAPGPALGQFGQQDAQALARRQPLAPLLFGDLFLRRAEVAPAAAVLHPEQVLQVVRDGQAAVGDALGDDALGPDAQGQVRPVVVAGLQLLPRFLERLLPRAVLEEPPQRRGRDLDTVVEVRLPERGDAQQLVPEARELLLEIVEPLQFPFLHAAAAALLAQPVGLIGHLPQLRFDEVVDARVEGLVGQPVVVEPEGVGAGRRGQAASRWAPGGGSWSSV